MQAAPHPSHTAETATPAPRAQDRFAQSVAPGVYPLRPVTFQCYGAGAQLSAEDSARVEFTFPVDAGRAVRISAHRETACEFAESLVETLGGWDAIRARHYKRGCRRGKASR